MRCAMGISTHTGWAACVVVSGSLGEPRIHANAVIEILRGPARFCYHRAAELGYEEAAEWIAGARTEALANAKQALSRLLTRDVGACAIVGKSEDPQWSLAEIVASHPRIHRAEGCFYRDVWREACAVPVSIVRPASLDVSKVGRLNPAPWGRDQKLAALAAWSVVRD